MACYCHGVCPYANSYFKSNSLLSLFDLSGCTSLMDKQCTNLHMAKIAAFLPKWKVVTKLLGLEEQIIRDIENRYPNGEDQ